MDKTVRSKLNRRKLSFKSEMILGLLLDIIKLEERCDELEKRCDELQAENNTIAVFYGVDFKSCSKNQED